MKILVLVALLAGTAVVAQGQTVFLKASPAGNRQSENTTVDANLRLIHTYREEKVAITVRNTSMAPLECVVECLFLTTPAKGGDPKPSFAEEKIVSLAQNATSSFQVDSPKVEATQKYERIMETYRLPNGGREQVERTRNLGIEGNKPAGYVVRVKANGKIIAVDASDSPLKRIYQNPNAPWTPTQKPKEDVTEKPAPKRKPSKK
jgi:hypothetical protein